MKILIDADIIKYRCGFAGEKTTYAFYWKEDVSVLEDPETEEEMYQTHGEPMYVAANAKEGKEWLAKQEEPDAFIRLPEKQIDPLEHVLHSTKLVMATIAGKYPQGESVLYFSCSTADNWRTTFYPEYKANRPDRKPFWADAIDAYLKKSWEWRMHDRYEADDLIAQAAYAYGMANQDCVVVTIDKDMDQIPGLHYHWVKDEEYVMTPPEAAKCLARQCITGDMTDNIRGIQGIGPQKAEDYLVSATGDSLGEIILGKYKEHYENEAQAKYEAALTTALVSLPVTDSHRDKLIAGVINARTNFEETAEDSNESA